MGRKQRDDRARLMSTQEVAYLLQVPVSTIYKWRTMGVGPRGIKVGQRVRFDPRDVVEWLETNKSPL